MSKSKIDLKKLSNFKKANKTTKQIAEYFGVTPSAVNKALKRIEANTNLNDKVEKTPAPKTVKKVKRTHELKKVKKFVIDSNKLTRYKHETIATTFGELLKELDIKAAEGVLRGVSAENMRNLVKNTDPLPEVFDQPIYLYLAPIKNDGGC